MTNSYLTKISHLDAIFSHFLVIYLCFSTSEMTHLCLEDSTGSILEMRLVVWHDPHFDPPPAWFSKIRIKNRRWYDLDRDRQFKRRDASKDSWNIHPIFQSKCQDDNTKWLYVDTSCISWMRKDDAEQHWFTCEAFWSMKKVTNDAARIT